KTQIALYELVLERTNQASFSHKLYVGAGQITEPTINRTLLPLTSTASSISAKSASLDSSVTSTATIPQTKKEEQKDSKESKEVKESKDAKDSKEVKDSKDAKTRSDTKAKFDDVPGTTVKPEFQTSIPIIDISERLSDDALQKFRRQIQSVLQTLKDD